MTLLKHYYKCSKISTVKFCYPLRLFALDLAASDAICLTRLGGRSVSAADVLICRRLYQFSPVPAELGRAFELDESYVSPRQVRGTCGWDTSGKTIVFGLFKCGGQVYTERVPDCSKKTLQGIIRGKISLATMVNTDG